jgi:predicted RNase H-like HicB family nuclease
LASFIFNSFEFEGIKIRIIKLLTQAHMYVIVFVNGADHMKAFTAIVEKCPSTGLYVGCVPGFSGAHSQGETLDELRQNLQEVIEMLLEDGTPALETEFVGTQTIQVA